MPVCKDLPPCTDEIGKKGTINMPKLKLNATTKPQELIKEYLEKSASDVLADKINNGSLIHKDGKTLINKKTLDGFMNYATNEAQKIAEKGSRCACIQDDVVFGWAIHYFEEDSIEEKLFNPDGTEYVKAKKSTTQKKTEKKNNAKKPIVEKDKLSIATDKIQFVTGKQMSLF